MEDNDEEESSFLMYIMVVGFHHKKGCLVEYCYPKLDASLFVDDPETSNGSDGEVHHQEACDDVSVALPSLWSSLPSLAIPDGAHNHTSDSVFFHLVHPRDSSRTVYGVACYQQIETKSLLVCSADMTRTSVQKSVVLLLRRPLYGLLEEKLKIVTQNYFCFRDFNQVSLLNEFYRNLNHQLSLTIMESLQIFSSFSLRKLFAHFGVEVIVLFKLLLLEKKVIFIYSPIRDVSSIILAVCSLVPGLLQDGLEQAACGPPPASCAASTNVLIQFSQEDNSEMLSSNDDKHTKSLIDDESFYDLFHSTNDAHASSELVSHAGHDLYTNVYAKHNQHYGFPLHIFHHNSYCLPYFSLNYFDVLVNETTRSCFVGTSNHIFRKCENDIDVFVCDDSIEIRDPNLKRALAPTIEDERFMAYVMQTLENEDGVIVDEQFNYTSSDYAQGSDEWIRCLFKNYLLHMLRASLFHESHQVYRSYNAHFVNAWKASHNYRVWSSRSNNVTTVVRDIDGQHPFADNRLNNLRFKISSSLLSYRSSLRNQAQQTSSKVMSNPLVASTLTTARTTVNSWLMNLGANLPAKVTSSFQKSIDRASHVQTKPQDSKSKNNEIPEESETSV